MRNLLTITLAISLGAFLPALPAAAQNRFTTIANFTNAAPSGLTPGYGVLYGATVGQTPVGTNCGMIFELQPPPSPSGMWTQSVLYAFADSNDFCSPGFNPVLGPDGALYGWANGAGGTASSLAGLYQLKPPAVAGAPWQETILYTYTGADNSVYVNGNLIPGPGGSFYALGGIGGITNEAPPQTDKPVMMHFRMTADSESQCMPFILRQYRVVVHIRRPLHCSTSRQPGVGLQGNRRAG